MASRFQQMGKLSLSVLLISLMAGCATTSEDSAATQETKPVASEATSSTPAPAAQGNANQVVFAIPWMRLDPATGRFYMQWVMWPSMNEYIVPQQAPASTKP